MSFSRQIQRNDSAGCGTLEEITPAKRPRFLSPRAYAARLDLCRLWDLMVARKTPGEIAQILGKDAAWVSRSIKKIQQDFHTVFPTPREKQAIAENLSQLESLYARALSITADGSAREQAIAIRAALDVLQAKATYEFRVGHVQERKPGQPCRIEEQEEEEPIPHLSLLAILEKVTERERAERSAAVN